MRIYNNRLPIHNYRPEIDGLRALAIIPVIINHFNKDILPNGYLGVDIFFVISGFIITSSIFSRPSKDFKKFLIGFYERRIKRLVPALSVFVLILSILICMFSQSPGQSLKTGIASLYGLSNIYLFQLSTNYFDSFTELNTFTHTWSLGVEEQFYLIYPFLIWFSGYGKKSKNSARNLFLCITVLALPSLVGFIHFYQSNLAASYFLMPFRFWEMASGCLLFLGFQKRSSLFLFFEKIPAIFITAAIIGIMFMPNYNSEFSTFLIVILSVILIASINKDKEAFKYFTNPYVIYIGKLSYSLYLWHWGILAISRWTIGVYWWTIPFQVLLILGSSIISYQFIETPLRKSNWFKLKWQNILFSGGVLATLSGFIYLNGKTFKGYLYTGKNPIYTTPHYDHCHLPNINIKTIKIPSECGSFNFKDSPTIYGVGDSHIEQFGHAISEIASKHNYNYSLLWQSTCFFPASVVSQKISNCFNNQTELENKLMRNISKGDIVIVGNFLFNLISENKLSKIYYDNEKNEVSKIKAVQIYKNKFIKFSEKVNSKGAKVILYIDSLIFPYLDLPGAACTEEWFRKSYNIPDKCKASLNSHIETFDKYFKWKEDWEDKKSKYVLNAYLYAENCKNNICSASNYNDNNHFTYQFAKKVLNNFIEENNSLLSGS